MIKKIGSSMRDITSIVQSIKNISQISEETRKIKTADSGVLLQELYEKCSELELKDKKDVVGANLSHLRTYIENKKNKNTNTNK
jgi:hypothetical protein